MTILWSKNRETFLQPDAMTICFFYKCHCSPNDHNIKGAKRRFPPLSAITATSAAASYVDLGNLDFDSNNRVPSCITVLLSVVGAIQELTSAANVDLGQLLVHRAIQLFLLFKLLETCCESRQRVLAN